MLAIAAPGSAVFVFFVFLHQWVEEKKQFDETGIRKIKKGKPAF